ncbi:hypothetical protein LCGC14_1085530 [marine sediment metagenome]|uniref:Uncharacterized protein n=1 Tax=marine sediment metagenome TaxID=412755 RepID=A0A0F9N1H9_9ZZZZ
MTFYTYLEKDIFSKSYHYGKKEITLKQQAPVFRTLSAAISDAIDTKTKIAGCRGEWIRTTDPVDDLVFCELKLADDVAIIEAALASLESLNTVDLTFLVCNYWGLINRPNIVRLCLDF